MPGVLAGFAIVVVAFLVGAIPWGYLVGHIAGGVDLRTVGSGSTGATNVLRTVGKRASAIVLALDFLKGSLPVFFAKWLGFGPWWVAAVAVATVVGHCWSPFIGFRGGKGVATGAGAAATLFPQTLLALPIMAAVIWLTRYVSLGSLVGAMLAAIAAIASAAAGLLAWPSAVAMVAIASIVVVRHAGNIERLRSGTERRIGEVIRV